MTERIAHKILPRIDSPADVRKLTVDEAVVLAGEVRDHIIWAVSQTGGHLATNLGAVELSVALHHVFNTPTDRIIWDVSHQVYAHKILTGRKDQMHTIRQYDGLSGFAKTTESEYDHFGAGHASTSISVALGFAAARDQAGLDHKVVAVIGDGSMTGGLAFEGMNNAGSLNKDLLVILNDNTWSISRNVGALSRYMTSIMSDERINKIRNEIWELTGKFKRREKIRKAISDIEDSVKGLVVPGMVFEKLGFRYFGPIDGHDLPLLIKTLEKLKHIHGPLMLHIATVKGKGYEPAEGDPYKYHGVGKFDKVSGKLAPKSDGHPAYTKVFGDTMVELAQKNEKVVAITAAMTSGTGLDAYAEKFPNRFYDVGIAEAHAGCFASGMAVEGQRPYLVIYSTFLQRAYDQIIHDIGIHQLPVVICMDRAGLVGDDGPTHHGVFDIPYLCAVPGFTVCAPKDGNELRSMLHHTASNDMGGPVAIRYPRENVPSDMTAEVQPIAWGKWEWLTPPSEIVILAVGTMVDQSRKVAEKLAERGVQVSIVNARFVKPMDYEILTEVRESARTIFTIEEGAMRGGFGQAVADYMLTSGYTGKFLSLGLPDEFVTHGARPLLLRDVGLDVDGILRSIDSVIAGTPEPQRNGFFQRLIFRKNGSVRKVG
ncbi:MAG: 1-deoxy-D-xylulose-5-phosphate synthase [Candidatus Zixiibacteriota bacterium]